MDLKDVKSIVDIMKRADLTEFEIEQDGLKLRIKRSPSDGKPSIYAVGSNPPFPIPGMDTASAPVGTPPAAPAAKPADPETGISIIKSPMVGTFYRASSPESEPFVEIGSAVTENATVCIIEAMKVMNEIQAETKGKIVEVLVENGKAVEYGQPLFKVKSA